MLYLCDSDLQKLQLDWQALVAYIREAVATIRKQDFVQPVKPYLRYGDLKNRIIAMPGFIGGSTQKAGIKWIASFPQNIHKGLRRANSVTIINNAETGYPEAIINGSYISAIRTAAVSGAMLMQYADSLRKDSLSIGMTGFGPIGQTHMDMIASLLGDRLDSVTVFDMKTIDPNQLKPEWRQKLKIADSWQNAFADRDAFVTGTVSSQRYIDSNGKDQSLHLNVSLRDYSSEVVRSMDRIIVDNWDEICREDTDIHRCHLEQGLKKEEAFEITECLDNPEFNWDGRVIFNPMGMAVFDIAIAKYFIEIAQEQSIGLNLHE